MLLSSVRGLAAALWCFASAAAQEVAPGEPTIEERAAKAIADYEAVRGDKAKAVQAGKLLEWLGDIDHPRTADYLGQLLAETKGDARALPVLKAIARVRRPALADDVWKLWVAEKGLPAVRGEAARTLVTMGDRVVDRVSDHVRKGEGGPERPVRDAGVLAIVQSKDDRAIRSLAPLLSQGTSDDRLQVVRLFAPVHGVPPISAARIKAIGEGTLALAAAAWRQLAEERHPRARDLAIDLLERMPSGPTPEVAADLIAGISMVRDPDLYPLLLRYGALPGSVIKRALRAAAENAAEDPELLHFLATDGLEDERPAARGAAMMLLDRAPAEAVQPLLARVRKGLRNPRKEDLDLAIGLNDLLAKDPTWRRDLLVLANARTPEVRTVGLSLLRGIGCGDAVEIAQKALAAKEWELRSAAIRYLTQFRDAASVPLLIARFGKEDGRLEAELANALFVHTGTRCFKKPEWEGWWNEHKTGFALPHEETVRSGMSGVSGYTAAYHGIPLVSKRVAFLIDTSGSMNAPMGTDKKFTRLDAAKEELSKVLDKLPPDFELNLIAYNTPVAALWKELHAADAAACDEIRKRLKSLRPAGGTNIYGALEEAFRDPAVDTIYLLTDGEPSVGEVVAPEDIAEEVVRWNHLRQITVHCIGLGIDSELLKRLADDSGGVYKFVK
ncbi:MAG: VWA domain-containing protein [Planctomycetota bacterium]